MAKENRSKDITSENTVSQFDVTEYDLTEEEMQPEPGRNRFGRLHRCNIRMLILSVILLMGLCAILLVRIRSLNGRITELTDQVRRLAQVTASQQALLEELTEEERVASRKKETNRRNIRGDFTFGYRCGDRAVDFLEKHGDEDFFLTMSLDEPHDPGLCPEPYASMFEDYEFPKSPNVWDTLEGKPQYQKIWAGKNRESDRDKVRIKVPGFLGCNSFADAQLGRVLESIARYAPDALVIYTSDHGDALESHCLYAKGPVMYNEVARIPLLIAGPGVPEGAVDKNPVSHINLPPLILEYMGVPVPKCFEGRSLLQEVYNPEIRTNDYVVTEFTRYEIDHDGFGGIQMMRAIFDGRYKLAVHLLDSTDEFYDQEKDPYEMKNLIWDEAYEEEKVRLHRLLLDWMNATRDPFRGYQWEHRQWRKGLGEPTWGYTGYTRQREAEEYEPRQLDYDTGLPMKEAVRKK